MHAKQKIDTIIQEQKHKTTALSVMIHPIILPITHTRDEPCASAIAALMKLSCAPASPNRRANGAYESPDEMTGHTLTLSERAEGGAAAADGQSKENERKKLVVETACSTRWLQAAWRRWVRMPVQRIGANKKQ